MDRNKRFKGVMLLMLVMLLIGSCVGTSHAKMFYLLDKNNEKSNYSIDVHIKTHQIVHIIFKNGKVVEFNKLPHEKEDLEYSYYNSTSGFGLMMAPENEGGGLVLGYQSMMMVFVPDTDTVDVTREDMGRPAKPDYVGSSPTVDFNQIEKNDLQQ